MKIKCLRNRSLAVFRFLERRIPINSIHPMGIWTCGALVALNLFYTGIGADIRFSGMRNVILGVIGIVDSVSSDLLNGLAQYTYPSDPSMTRAGDSFGGSIQLLDPTIYIPHRPFA
jgi:hypothetical protein